MVFSDKNNLEVELARNCGFLEITIIYPFNLYVRACVCVSIHTLYNTHSIL